MKVCSRVRERVRAIRDNDWEVTGIRRFLDPNDLLESGYQDAQTYDPDGKLWEKYFKPLHKRHYYRKGWKLARGRGLRGVAPSRPEPVKPVCRVYGDRHRHSTTGGAWRCDCGHTEPRLILGGGA